MSWHGPSLWADSPETLGHIYQPASPRSFHRARDGSCPPGKHHLSLSFFSFFVRFLIPRRGTCGSDKVNTSHNSLGGLSPGVDDDVFLLWGKGKSIFCKLKFPECRIQQWKCEVIEMILFILTWLTFNNMFLQLEKRELVSSIFLFTQKLLLDLENMNSVLKSYIYKGPQTVQKTKQQRKSRSFCS